MQRKILFFLLIFSCFAKAGAEPPACHPSLWPNLISSSSQQHQAIDVLNKAAKKALKQPSRTIPILGSAGKINSNDTILIASHKAFLEADDAAVLALMFNLTHDEKYFTKTRTILLNWAKINTPTGQPIDETRLEGLIWAYDLISCQLNPNDKKIILSWFAKWQQKKLAWKFGPKTTTNNHRVHHLKILTMLDIILNDQQNLQQNLKTAKNVLNINIDEKTGESIDYRERHALHYQNYVLQAWLEMSLINQLPFQPLDTAFHFLTQRINTHELTGEFTHSTAKIDAERARGGFAYAKSGGKFNVEDAAPTFIMYETLTNKKLSAYLQIIIQDAKNSPWFTFLKARELLWKKDNLSFHKNKKRKKTLSAFQKLKAFLCG